MPKQSDTKISLSLVNHYFFFPSPKLNIKFLYLDVLQMMGRAGRPQFDTLGIGKWRFPFPVNVPKNNKNNITSCDNGA